MFAAPIFFLIFSFCSTVILANLWGDVVFYYQTTPYSQSAGVLHGYWPIGSLPSSPYNCEKLCIYVEKSKKQTSAVFLRRKE
jgi:hypothetical protein